MKHGIFLFIFVVAGQLVYATKEVPPESPKMGVAPRKHVNQATQPQSFKKNCREVYDCCCCTCKECVVPCVSYTCRECVVPCAQETARCCWNYKKPIAAYLAFSGTCSALCSLCMQWQQSQSNSMY